MIEFSFESRRKNFRVKYFQWTAVYTSILESDVLLKMGEAFRPGGFVKYSVRPLVSQMWAFLVKSNKRCPNDNVSIVRNGSILA